MDVVNIVILALGAIGGPTTVVALYKWAKAQGRAEAVQEQSKKTILALEKTNAALENSFSTVTAENTRLWSLIVTLQEKS